MSMIETTRSISPFHGYRAPRLPVVPIERVRPRKVAKDVPELPPAPPVIIRPRINHVTKTAFEISREWHKRNGLVMGLTIAKVETKPAIPEPDERAAAFARVVNATCEHYAVGYDEMCGPRREQRLALARHVAQWLVRKHCPWLSFPDIGRRFGDRDHSTCLHAVRRIDRLLATDQSVCAAILQISSMAGVGK